MMKLHAFADRSADADADLGRHHALDVYRIVAMLAEDEFEQVRQRVTQHGASLPVIRARQIVRDHFAEHIKTMND